MAPDALIHFESQELRFVLAGTFGVARVPKLSWKIFGVFQGAITGSWLGVNIKYREENANAPSRALDVFLLLQIGHVGNLPVRRGDEDIRVLRMPPTRTAMEKSVGKKQNQAKPGKNPPSAKGGNQANAEKPDQKGQGLAHGPGMKVTSHDDAEEKGNLAVKPAEATTKFG
jgi:hypothetical protein